MNHPKSKKSLKPGTGKNKKPGRGRALKTWFENIAEMFPEQYRTI
jgi:hypothetical protein